MKTVYVVGAGAVKLNQNDFIASGGEGEIYGKGDRVFKLYHDPQKMIPQGKFDELLTLTEPHIVSPQDLLVSKSKVPIGFTMVWFKNNYPICKVFTNGFRRKSGFTEKDAVKLVENMQQLIDFVHSKDCLIVDFNDVNFLIDSNNLVQPMFIDVDSYKTPNYPPTAITPYAQDHHASQFSPLSDWFSFGIIAFQIFIGMHPFKGTHPRFNKGAVVDRLKANISAFNSEVSLPPAARSFDHIPSELRVWMEDMFEKGKRVPPPMVAGRLQVAKPTYTKIKSSKYFTITLFKSFPEEIDFHFESMTQNVVKYGNTISVGTRNFQLMHNDSEIVLEPNTMVPIEFTKDKFRLADNSVEVPLILNIDSLKVAHNTIIAKAHEKLVDISIQNFGKYTASINNTWSVLPYATKLYSGMALQNVLGVPYIWIPEVKKGTTQLIGEFIKVPELSGYKIISAKCIKNVAVIIGYKGHEYSRFVLKHHKGKYEIRIVENVDYQNEINFTVLDKGVVVMLNENSEIEIFRAELGHNSVKAIEDDQIDQNCILTSNGSQVMFYKGKELYKLTMSGK